MRFGKTLSALAGVLGGLALGFGLWGIQVSELRWTLRKTSQELSQAQAWLRDEIRTSDERYEQVSDTLKKALADLARARGDVPRTSSALRSPVAPSASLPSASPASVSLPSASPPSVRPPSASLPSVRPPSASLPSASLPSATPPTMSPPSPPDADLRWPIPPQ
jgi:hypothetical protein